MSDDIIALYLREKKETEIFMIEKKHTCGFDILLILYIIGKPRNISWFLSALFLAKYSLIVLEAEIVA